METLENDPRNTCVGCGPENPRGLRLVFRKDGDRVIGLFEAVESLEGWPGRLHSGILYTALLDTANWTVYGTLGRIGLPTDTSALALRRWVRTHEQPTLVGHLAEVEGGGARVEAEARAASGDVVGSLTRRYAFPTRHEFAARMGYEELPEVLRDLLPE